MKLLFGSTVLAGLLVAGCDTTPEEQLPPVELEPTKLTIKNSLSTPIFVRSSPPGNLERHWNTIVDEAGRPLMRAYDSCTNAECDGKAAPVLCDRAPAQPNAIPVAAGSSISETWNGTYFKRAGDTACVTRHVIESKPISVWLCFGYDESGDGRGVLDEICTEHSFTPGVDREVLVDVTRPKPASVELILENKTNATIYIQATVSCSAEPGWVEIFDGAGDRLFPNAVEFCSPCICGAAQCALCERNERRACLAPLVEAIAPGESRSVSYDGYHYETVSYENGTICAQPAYAIDRPLTSKLCWGHESPGESFGMIPNPTCHESSFTFGQVTEVRVAVE